MITTDKYSKKGKPKPDKEPLAVKEKKYHDKITKTSYKNTT
jgi:hypothetical protein